MKCYQRLGFIFGIVTLLASVNFAVFALDNDESRVTLQGLKRFNVLVETISSEIKQDGLTEMQIQNDVELTLKQAGIEFLSEEKWENERGGPCLYVRPNIYKPWPGFYFCCINISLVQDVVLKRNSNIAVLSPTWSTGKFGVTYSLKGIRDSIKDCADRFINAYLSANPKQEQAKSRPHPIQKGESR